MKKDFTGAGNNISSVSERMILGAKGTPVQDTHNTHNTDEAHSTHNTNITYDTLDTLNTPNKGGRPKQTGEFYRINLKVPKELEEPIREARHRQRKATITQYIVDLIRADVEI